MHARKFQVSEELYPFAPHWFERGGSAMHTYRIWKSAGVGCYQDCEYANSGTSASRQCALMRSFPKSRNSGCRLQLLRLERTYLEVRVRTAF